MDRKTLESYAALNREVMRLERRKERFLKKPDTDVTDVVSGSLSQYPYIETRFKITGSSTGFLACIEKELDEAQKRAEKALMDIMNFINSIEDSLTREIFRCKYIDCHTWKQVGILNCVSKDYARRVVREYLQKK